MAPTIPTTLAAHARDLLESAVKIRRGAEQQQQPHDARALTGAGAAAAAGVAGPLLAKREDPTPGENHYKLDPHSGTSNFRDFNNTGVFVLFGLIGLALVCAGIWFFFWARNGGFVFRKDDWDDYKSTVLRRKGPNGTLLSGATPTTKLGGGSIYKDYDHNDARTEYTGGLTEMSGNTGSTLSGITAGASDILGRQKRKEKRERRDRERREREKEKKRDRKSRSRSKARRGGEDEEEDGQGEDGALVDAQAEKEAQSHLRAYRHERPARVGGINKESEGSQWDGSTAPDMSTTAGSDVQSGHGGSPAKSSGGRSSESRRERAERKAKSGGIRKVYSTADRTHDREQEHIRAEARRLADKGRAAGSGRRDFSYQRAESYQGSNGHNRGHSRTDAGAANTIEEESDIGLLRNHGDPHHGGNNRSSRYLAPGAWEEEEASDVGTKAYHHVIPGLSSNGSASGGGSDLSSYQDEKRKKRGAGKYRRGQE